MKKILLFFYLLVTVQIINAQSSETNKTEIDGLTKKLEKLEKQINKKDKKNGFKVSIGGSFDFSKGLSATDLYSDLAYYNLDVWPRTGRKGRNRNIGLDFKLYQSLLFSNPADTNRINSFTSVRLGEAPTDSILVGDFSFDRSEELDLKDFGLYIRPTLRLSKTVYLFGHAEFLFRETIQKINYNAIDTVAIRKVSKDFVTKSTLPSSRNTKYHDALSFFGIGFGFNLDLADSSVCFRINPTVGFSNILNASRISSPLGSGTIEGRTKVFYLLDIEIIEKKSGVKLGINIRDNNRDNNEGLLDKPRFSIFLSKQFSLSKLADFLKSK